MKDFDCYIEVERGEKIPEFNKEVILQIRDRKTMELFNAKVFIYPSPDEYPGLDKIWFFSATSGRQKTPNGVKVIEKFEEKVPEVKRLEKQKISIGKRKGRMLMDMIKEREGKKKN